MAFYHFFVLILQQLVPWCENFTWPYSIIHMKELWCLHYIEGPFSNPTTLQHSSVTEFIKFCEQTTLLCSCETFVTVGADQSFILTLSAIFYWNWTSILPSEINLNTTLTDLSLIWGVTFTLSIFIIFCLSLIWSFCSLHLLVFLSIFNIICLL